MRKAVLIATGVLLIIEAVGIALLNLVLGLVVDRQRMSLAGMDPDVMSVGTVVLGVVSGLCLVAVAVLLLRSGLAGRPLGSVARVLVIVCAVIHGLIGAMLVGLAGWAAFTGAMAVLALLVLSLLLIPEDDAPGYAGPVDAPPPPPVVPPAEPGATAVRG